MMKRNLLRAIPYAVMLATLVGGHAATGATLDAGWRILRDATVLAPPASDASNWVDLVEDQSRAHRLAQPREPGQMIWLDRVFDAPEAAGMAGYVILTVEHAVAVERVWINGHECADLVRRASHRPDPPEWKGVSRSWRREWGVQEPWDIGNFSESRDRAYAEVDWGRPATFAVPLNALQPKGNRFIVQAWDQPHEATDSTLGRFEVRPAMVTDLLESFGYGRLTGEFGSEGVAGVKPRVPVTMALTGTAEIQDALGAVLRTEKLSLALAGTAAVETPLAVTDGREYKAVVKWQVGDASLPDHWVYFMPRLARSGSRAKFSLEGGDWEFRPFPKGEELTASGDRADLPWATTYVPGGPLGGGWNFAWKTHRVLLRKRFTLPPEFAGQRVVLRVGGVREKAVVRVNGREVGAVRFMDPIGVFDVTDLVQVGGQNEILMVLQDWSAFLLPGSPMPEDGEGPKRGTMLSGWPYPVMNVRDEVSVETVPAVSIERTWVRTSVRERTLWVKTWIRNGGTSAVTVRPRLTVLKQDKTLFNFEGEAVEVPAGQVREVVTVRPWADAVLWEPWNPVLYGLQTELLAAAAGAPMDCTVTRFGFREFGIDGTRITLNGRTLHLNGANRCQYGTGEMGRLDASFLASDLRKARGIGYNITRESPRGTPAFFWALGDEIGILGNVNSSLSDMGQGNLDYNSRVAHQNFLDEIRSYALDYYNHPSILVWNYGNELPTGLHPKLADLMEWVCAEVKQYDPTRLVMTDGSGDASGRLELYSAHYTPRRTFGMYSDQERASIDARLTRSGDAEMGEGSNLTGESWKGDKPFVDSEYNWLHHDMLLQDGLSDTGEAALKPGPKRGNLLRENVNPYLSDFVAVYQRQRQRNQLDLRAERRAGMILLDYPFHDYRNASALLVAFHDRRVRFAAGAPVRQMACVFNDTGRDEKVAVELRVGDGPNGTERVAWRQEVTIAHASDAWFPIEVAGINAAVSTRIPVRLVASVAGEVRSEAQRVWEVFPAGGSGAVEGVRVAVVGGDTAAAAAMLRPLGIAATRLDSVAGVAAGSADLLVIGEQVDPKSFARAAVALLDFAEQGGTVLVLAQADAPWLPMALEYQKRRRPHGGGLDSGYLTQMLAPKHPVFEGLVSEDLSGWGVIGATYLLSFKPPMGGNCRTLAGLPPNDATLLELATGKGRFLVTTLEFTAETVGQDPAVARLLANIVRYAKTPEAARAKTVVYSGGGERVKQLQETLRLEATYTVKEAPVLDGVGLLVLDGFVSDDDQAEVGLNFVHGSMGADRPLGLRNLVLREAGAAGKDVIRWQTDTMEPFVFEKKGSTDVETKGNPPTYFSFHAWDAESVVRLALEPDAVDGKPAMWLRNLSGKPALLFYNWQKFKIKTATTYEVAFSYRATGEAKCTLVFGDKTERAFTLSDTAGAWREFSQSFAVDAIRNVPPESFKAPLKTFAEGGGTILAELIDAPMAAWLGSALGVEIDVKPVIATHAVKTVEDPLLAGISDGDLLWLNMDRRFDPFLRWSTTEHDVIRQSAVPVGAKVLTHPAVLCVLPVGKGRLVVNQARWGEVSNKTRVYWGFDSRKLAQRFEANLLVNLGANLKLPPRAAAQSEVVGLVFEPLNLSAFMNRGLVDEKTADGIGWLDLGFPWNMRVPAGRLVAAEVPFEIIDEASNGGNACIALRGRGAQRDLPDRTVAIPVGKKAKSLFFLHTSGYNQSKDGEDVWTYEIHYEGFSKVIPGADPGGLRVVVPVKAGLDVGDWSGVPTALPGWKMYDKPTNKQINLYVQRWDNPNPERVIESIQIKSLGKPETPFVFGITLGHPAANLIAAGDIATMSGYSGEWRGGKRVAEQGSIAKPWSWNCWDPTGVARVTVEPDPVEQRPALVLQNLEGRSSLQLYVDPQWNPIPVVSGKKYRLAFRYLTTGGGATSFKWSVVRQPKDTETLAGEEVGRLMSEGRWSTYMTDFTVKESGLFKLMWNPNECTKATQALYLRDIWLTEEP